MIANVGDKVRIKNGAHVGERGHVTKIHKETMTVSLDRTDNNIRIPASDVTNFSLAARKAWKKMPQRRVGRPKGSGTTDRVSVTLRIDRELWNQFKMAERAGLIENRTATINEWFAEKLAKPARQME